MHTGANKVLFVTSSLNLGGAERQLLLLCENLRSQVEIQIISLDPDGPLKEKYLQAFPEIFFLDKSSLFNCFYRLRKIIKTSNPDVVITWLYRADLLGGLATKLAGNIPIIWSARNSSIPNFTFLKRRLLTVLSKIIPRMVVANGSPAHDFHTSIGYPSKKFVIIF